MITIACGVILGLLAFPFVAAILGAMLGAIGDLFKRDQYPANNAPVYDPLTGRYLSGPAVIGRELGTLFCQIRRAFRHAFQWIGEL